MHNVLIEYYFNSGHYGVITNLTQPPFEMQRPAECTAPERPCSWGKCLECVHGRLWRGVESFAVFVSLAAEIRCSSFLC